MLSTLAGRQGPAMMWLGATLVLGLAFLAVEIYEFHH